MRRFAKTKHQQAGLVTGNVLFLLADAQVPDAGDDAVQAIESGGTRKTKNQHRQDGKRTDGGEYQITAHRQS